MYPGYSPADHEYGKAADEYGRYASSARAQGIDVRPKDVEYEIGQSKRMKRQPLGGTGSTRTAQESGSGSGAGSGSGSDRPNNKHRKHNSTNGHAEVEQAQEESHELHDESGKPAFFIDVNPTPVDLPPMKDKLPKRGASSPETAEGKKHKKIKKKHTGNLPDTTDENSIEYEDISQEVDARLKEKEERRKRKEEEKKRKEEEIKPKEEERKGKEEERKRRRGSGESAAVEAEAPSAIELEKPKKKRLRKSDGINRSHVPDATDSPSKKRHGADNDNEHGEGKKKKRKKSKDLS